MLDRKIIGERLLEFEARFGRGGGVDAYFAPGRVNIIGEHTDYNGGLALPSAIEQGTYFLVRSSELPPARLFSANRDEEAHFDPSNIEKVGDWADYVRGVYLYASGPCGDLPPFDGMYFGDLPLGAGLSSSASLELVTAIGLQSLGCTMSTERAVIVSRRAENSFVGVSCGVMDQFAVAFAREGHAILLDCDTLDFRHVPYNLDDAVLVVGHTGIYRSLADTPYNTRRAECEEALGLLSDRLGGRRNLREVGLTEFEQARHALPELLEGRAEHVIRENVRVEEAARCLESGDGEKLGHLMNRSHESMRDLFDISSPEIEAMRNISMEMPGVWGCRLTGGGFGGCVISLIQSESVERYLAEVPERYWGDTHFEPRFTVTKPAGGARKLEVGS